MTDPRTYEEALSQGYEPVANIEDILTEKRKADKALDFDSDIASEATAVTCSDAPLGTKCFDWTNDHGVRIICFCTQGKTCGNCVQKTVR